MLETIRDGDQIVAMIVRAGYRASGIEFFTPPDFAQQMGYMSRPKGYRIEPHTHEDFPRTIPRTQEVLVIRSGRVKVDYFSDDQVYLSSSVLHTGDVILLASGGHGFTMLENAEMIEIKQGPYAEDRDKVRFAPQEGADE